jgi:RNA polymerase sigma-70 factor (ECF subfamily)
MAESPEDRALFAAAAAKDPRASGESGDARWVKAARDGDRAAFGQLYSEYAPMVHGLLLARVPASAVDDLLQDVFVQALRRLETLRDFARFGAWIAKIARNRANDYFRNSPSEEPLNDLEPAANSSATGDAREVLAAIRRLPDAYRETLVLRLVEGMSGPEIAARTGLTEGSVRVNLHRGMQQLRERLAKRPAKERP